MLKLQHLASGIPPLVPVPDAPYVTDKVNHGYLPLYEKYMPDEVDRFMEIGVWKGDSLRMFRDAYGGKGKFHALDTFGADVVPYTRLLAEGFAIHKGSQSDLEFLSGIKDWFDVVVEDGSHHSDEQIITFKHIFVHNIRPGGWYVLEDLVCCCESYWWRSVLRYRDTMLPTLQRVMMGFDFTSQLISEQESDLLMSLIDEIHLENANNNPIAFIRKKSC